MQALATKSIADDPSPRIWQVGLVLCLILASYVQFITVTQTVVDTPIRADAADYVTYAHNLKTSGVYSREAPGPGLVLTPDSLRAPGYPIFLLPFLDPSVDGEMLVGRITGAQGIIAVLSVLLVFELARAVVGPQWALPAALAHAVSPHFATASTYVLTETLFTFLVLASALVAARAWQHSRGWWMAAGAGLLLGAACLVRPTLQLLPLAALLVLPFAREAWQRRSALALLAAFLCVYGPWLVRNATLPEGSTDQSMAASQILHGSYPDMMFNGDPRSYGLAYRFDPAAADAQRSVSAATAVVLERAGADPLAYMRWYLVGKPLTFLSWGMIAGSGDLFVYPVHASPYIDRGDFRAMAGLAKALHWPMVIMALSALVVMASSAVSAQGSRRWNAASTIVAAIVVYAIALHMIVAPYPRYAIPFRPFLAILALLAARSAWEWYSQRQNQRIPTNT